MSNSFKSRKAEIISSQSIKWLLVLLVMGILLISYFNYNDSIKSNLDKKIINNLKMEEELCRASTSACNVKICTEDIECTDKEKKKSDNYLEFKEDCDSKSNQDKDELCSGTIYQMITNQLNEVKVSNDNYEKGGGTVNKEETKKTISESISLAEFAEKYSIEKEKLQAILDIESKANALDNEGFPTVRFECHIFNDMNTRYCDEYRKDDDEKLDCTINSGEFFSKVSSETNKEAFLKAKKINSDLAICSSSFGMAQVMGFNYKFVGFNSMDEFYKAMLKKEGQITAFLNYIRNKEIVFDQLRSKDTNWKIVADGYNGAASDANNYATKLETKYNELKTTALA